MQNLRNLRHFIIAFMLSAISVLCFCTYPVKSYAASTDTIVNESPTIFSKMVSYNPLNVNSDTAAIRVGFYPIKGFFEYDSNVMESGYGVELINEISKYSGYSFSFVPVENLHAASKALESGSIDLLMPVSVSLRSSDAFTYTERSIIDNYYVLMTERSRQDLMYEDYDTFSRIRIAVLSSFYDDSTLRHYLSDYSINSSELVLCHTYDECRTLLKEGEVDAIITDVMNYDDSSMKMLERFHTETNYIAMRKDDSRIYDINEAITRISLDNPTFFTDQYRQYFPERLVTPLTGEESAYLKSLGTLNFIFWDGQGYLCTKDSSGEFIGIFPALAKEICKKLNVQMKITEVKGSNWTTSFDKNSPYIFTQIAFDSKSNYQNNHLMLTEPYLTVDYCQVYRKDENIDFVHGKIAVPRGYYYVSAYIEKTFPPERIVYYDTIPQCLDAVHEGKVDYTIINNYVGEYYLLMSKYRNLSQRLISFNNRISIGVLNDDNVLLTSAINKTIASIDTKEWNDIIISNTSFKPEQNPISTFFYENPGISMLMAGLLVLLLSTLIFLSFFISYMHRKNCELLSVTTAKSNFMSRMSHDLRTPISTIIGLTALARDHVDEPAAMNKMLSQISLSSRYLLGLVNDSLDLDKISNGKMELHISDYPYVDFYNSMKTMIEPLCKEKGITFIMTDPKEVPYVGKNDKLRVEQIFFNLLSNAVKFTPRGGKIELLTLNNVRTAGTASCDCIVRDNGIGMSEEFQEHMFEPFSQENGSYVTQAEGSGLGLSIVKRIVELMHAEMTVKSAPGKGTEFHIHFNLAISSTTPVYKGAIPEASALPDDIKKYIELIRGKHILLVEDHPINLEIAKTILNKADISVITATTGKEALDKFSASEEGYFDGILMDIRMPIMDGLEASKRIRLLKRSDSMAIPIIAMTANAFDSDISATLKAGMNAHLTKPVEPLILYKTLSKYI